MDLKDICWESVMEEGLMREESHSHLMNLCDEAKSRCRNIVLTEGKVHFIDRILKNGLDHQKRNHPTSVFLWVGNLKEIRWESVRNEGWMRKESHSHLRNLYD